MTQTASDRIASIILGDSAPIRKLRQLIARVGKSSAAVLIYGETGSGKDLVARALHEIGNRTGAYMPVNVCTIPESLFESVVFGHARGSFSGATRDRVGVLDLVHNGTLFLDEISRLEMVAQPKLLRALETHEYSRLGEESLVRCSNFRLVSASNESLEDLVRRSLFRSDLLHRLRAIVLQVPPLRERVEDIPTLVSHFATLVAKRDSRPWMPISNTALELLRSYDWPGNVRELLAVIDAAIALEQTGAIQYSTVRQLLEDARPPQAPHDHSSQRQMLQEALDRAKGKVKVAAAEYSVHFTTMYRWLAEEGIALPRRRASVLRPDLPPDGVNSPE